MVKGYSYRFDVLSIRGQIIGDISVIGVIRVRCWRLHSKRLITIYNMIYGI